MATEKFVVTGDQYRVIDRRMREVKRQLDQEGGSPLDPNWVAGELQRVVEGRGDSEVYPVVVDFADFLAEMIAAGKYDRINKDITPDHFPTKGGEGRVEKDLMLVHLNCSARTEEALKEIDRLGLKPETIESLLAFGAKFPDKQREFPIIALGSVWQHPNGNRRVACLDEDASKRLLYLYWCEDDWYDYCRFLAARK